jgi:acetolactate synthase I/II/III large subunit
LPEDMLASRASCVDAARVEPVEASPSVDQIAAARELVAAAKRPLVLVGGSRWDEEACAALRRFAEANDLPVACSFRHQHLFDNRHANYAGDIGIGVSPKLAARVRDADVLLVIGERLGEITTGGYTLLDVPLPAQTLIHVHPGPDELGRVYQPALAIAATPRAFLAGMGLAAHSRRDPGRYAAAAHAEYEAWRAPQPVPGTLDLWQIVRWLDQRLPDDAILANGAGNYATWLQRVYRYRGFRTQLGPYSGAMGYGVPAGIAAKILHPERVVVSWNGDGCFLMNGQELATAGQYELGVIFVVVDNGMYGTIRMHQERTYPARVHGTALANPDFAALARAYGAHAETVTCTAEFAPAFDRALAAQKPALLHLKLDPQALTMNASLDELRTQGLAARR